MYCPNGSVLCLSMPAQDCAEHLIALPSRYLKLPPITFPSLSSSSQTNAPLPEFLH